LSGRSLATARQAFASSDDVRRTTGLVGVVFTVFYATSFFTALQRVYLRAWRRPPRGNITNYVRGPTWMLGVLAYFALVGGVQTLLGSGPGTAAFLLVSFAGSIVLWWLTAWLMLLGQVRRRIVLASGVITGIALTAYAAAATVWMPGIVTRNQHRYGFFGVSLALVTWFSGAAICIVVGACAAPVLAEDPGPIGRWVRGRSPSVLVPGAARGQRRRRRHPAAVAAKAPLASPRYVTPLKHDRHAARRSAGLALARRRSRNLGCKMVATRDTTRPRTSRPGPLTCSYLVAGEGFEPSTFGL
jgi:hypothetical protein